MPKQKSYSELEKEKARGKRRFLERVAETEEAEKLIREYTPEPVEFPESIQLGDVE